MKGLIYFILLFVIPGLVLSNEQTQVTSTIEDLNTLVTASQILETDGDQRASTSSSTQLLMDAERTEHESLSVTPSSVLELASSTIAVTSATDEESSQVSLEPEKIEASEPVKTSSSTRLTDETETVTQSTPVDQLETPTQFETYSSDEKSQSLKVAELKVEDEKVAGEITGEEIIDAIRSQPEQPNGFHEPIIHEKPHGGTEEVPGVSGTQTNAKNDMDIKSEEEGLTFNEWTQKILTEEKEAEKDKLDTVKRDSTNKIVAPTPKQRKKKNFASAECGAKVLSFNPESTNPKGILNSNKDDYMINPCKVKKWVIIELCEPIQAHSVDIASLELFSSQPKKFKIYLSDRYPTKDWKFALETTLKDERIIHSFDLTGSHDYFAKFVKIELVDHFGDEHFCPLTILKVFGIAVTEYEDINQEEPEQDNMDDDNSLNGDVEENSKNLFDSARETVMTLVKKVLNVDPDHSAKGNKTENSETGQEDGSTNGTDSTESNDIKPQLPNASILVEKLEKDQSLIDQDRTLPRVPEPGKTDSKSIVTKLTDDEQMETGSALELNNYSSRNKSILQDFITCEGNKIRKYEQNNRCRKMSGRCQFISMIMRTTSHMSFSNKQKDVNLFEGKATTYDPTKNTKKENLRSLESDLSSSSDVPSSTQIQAASDKQSAGLSHSIEKDGSFILVGTLTESQQQSSVITEQPSDVVNPVDKEKSVVSEATVLSSKIEIKPTTSTDIMMQTDSKDIPSGSTKSKMESTNTKPQQANSQDSKKTDSIHINPSPTTTVLDIDKTGTSLKMETTPSLPESWKPDTKDVLETDTQSESETFIQAGDKLSKVQSSTTSDITESAVLSKTVTSDEPESSAADSSSNTGDSTGLNLQPSQSSSASTSSQTPTVDLPKTSNQDTEVKVIPDVAMETQDNKKDVPQEEVLNINGLNTTIVDEKLEMKVKTEKNLDIKIPPMTGTNRETAIMRLSNRIKVLEQNVSLSSRFLEELSKRYKKQSEDMMKLLNKTLSKMSNMTTENDVKNKIRDDEMYSMERQLENLTERVTHLTNSLQTLNQQVTDRQMIATSIEILIVVVIFIVMSRLGKKESLSPEVKKLIESMPSKAPLNLTHRRNSISGPATPSKKYTSVMDVGGTLNKFPSETSLDLRIIEPSQSLFGTQKASDGVKKKKKKKQRSLDGRGSLTGLEMTKSFPKTVHPEVKSKHSWNNTNGQTESTDKMNAVKKKHDHTGNPSWMGGAIAKKPSLSSGWKKDDENGIGSPNTGRRDKNSYKGHRRQKSLPKQHYTDEEFRKQALTDSYTGVNPLNYPIHISKTGGLAAEKAVDPSKSCQKKDEYYDGKHFTNQRQSDNSLRNTEQKTFYGKGRKSFLPEQRNGNKVFQNHNSDHKTTIYKNSVNGQAESVGSVGLGAMDSESLSDSQHSTQKFKSLNDFDNLLVFHEKHTHGTSPDSDMVFNGNDLHGTSQNFLFNDISPTSAMNGFNSHDGSDNELENNPWISSENGTRGECNNSVLKEGKGFKKLWGFLK